jgi:hypothetical protein
MSDGSIIERDVVIQTMSGEIQPLTGKRAELPLIFSDQIRQFAQRETQEFDDLIRALAG